MDVSCRMRFLMLLLIIIKVRSTNTLRISVSDNKANWSSAGKTCQIIGPKDLVGIKVTNLYQSQHQSDFAWINVSISFTQWTLYRGCAAVRPKFAKNVFNIPQNKDYLLFCIEQCNGRKYLGLKDNKCVCLDIETLELKYVLRYCLSKPCTFDQYALCGSSEEYNTAYAVYEFVDLNTEIGGFYNCLSAMKKNNENSFTFESSNCEMKKNTICQRVLQSPELRNWTSSNVACNHPYNESQYNSQISPGQYWTAYSRRSEEIDISVKNPEYCVAAKVSQDGNLRKEIRKCNEKLHVLCNGTGHQSRNTDNIVPVINDKPTVDVKPSTNTTPHVDDPKATGHHSMNTGNHIPAMEATPTVDIKPSTDDTPYTDIPGDKDTNNPPSTVDAAGINETNEEQTILIIIVSVVSTVVLSLIIGMIVCKARRKRRSTERDITSAQQQVYAEVQRQSSYVSESRKANDIPLCSKNTTRTDPSPTDEVYDCTNHTLRPQVITDNNYDTMQNVMADNEDLENVYNTSNEVVVFNTVVDDSSEYSHVKIV